jgi:hypothetical protein
MAFVERRGRVWRARWALGDGRYGSRSGFATRSAAKAYADEREAAAHLGSPLAGTGLTVGEWWDRWIPALDLAPATREAYAQQYRRHVGPRFGQSRSLGSRAVTCRALPEICARRGLRPRP